MNPLYSKAAASPIICRRIAATAAAATTSATTATSSPSLLLSSSSAVGRSARRNAGHLSKIAAKAQELQAAKAAALAAASSTTGGRGGHNALNGPGTPGSADRMMAKILEDKAAELNRELTPAEKQKYELRLLKMKMSRKQYMKWLRANPQKPVDIPNEKLVVPEGHGENIWLWNHIEAGHVVYSLHPQMDSNKALAQFPYTGKKLVPPKLRRDYWRPFAQIQFPPGHGEVGRSVWQKLLELKKRHELEWGENQRYDFLHMTREDRGRALNDQRANVIADISAVLGGMGKGNKIWLGLAELKEAEKKARMTKKKVVIVEEKTEEKKEEEGKKEEKEVKVVEAKEETTTTTTIKPRLCEVKVYWTNAFDKHNAEKWSDNVTHFVGIPGKDVESVQLDVKVEPVVEQKPVVEEAKKEGEATA